MDRKFDIDDRVICSESGVIGKAIKFYTPTSCAEQTMVLCDDGRKYHAPTSSWSKTGGKVCKLIITDEYMEMYRSLSVPSNLLGGGL